MNRLLLALSGLLLTLLLALSPALAFVPGTEPAADFTDFEDPFEAAQPEIADPLEPFNRAAFWLNDQLYTRILQPLCDAAPEGLRSLLSGVLERGGTPLQAGGAELQFRLRDAGSELGRFLLHSLIGLLDRIHPETTAPLAAGSEDFGRTLESFGIGSGFYLVLPVVGPSSLRDGIGMVTGLYLEPSPHLFNLRRCTWYDVEEKSLLGHLKAYQAIRKESLDPYLSIRNAYAQQRESSGKETFSLSGGAGRASAERVANLKVSDPG